MTDTCTWEYTDDGCKWRIEANNGIGKAFCDTGDGVWKEMKIGYHDQFLADLVEQLNAQKAVITNLEDLNRQLVHDLDDAQKSYDRCANLYANLQDLYDELKAREAS